MTYESLYYATNNLTASSTIVSFGSLAIGLVLAYMLYVLARSFKDELNIWLKVKRNRVYLDDVCTSYKVGYLKQKAEEEGIVLEDVPEPKRRTIADKLKEEVDNEIAK